MSNEEFTAGLRAFADWLDANPETQAPQHQRLLLALSTNTAVEEFAAGHGLTVAYDDDGNASCALKFGPITYHAYGYVDFEATRDKHMERDAREWAGRKGMEIVPAAGGEAA